MQKISPFLWFDDQAEEAASFYVSTFKNSRILDVVRYGEAGPGAPGSVMVVAFEIGGEKITALNGGPVFTFSPAISLVVNCETQDEVDELWEKLSEGGEPGQCGWLTDRYGLSWQIVPTALSEVLSGPDPAGSQRAMNAMLQMGKLDIEVLRRAYENEQEAQSEAA